MAVLTVTVFARVCIRTALSVLDTDNEALREVGQAILSGASVEGAFAGVIPPAYAHLHGLIATGEAREDRLRGLTRQPGSCPPGGRSMHTLRCLELPSLCFRHAIAALCVILLMVVSAIAPPLQDTNKDLSESSYF